MTYLATSILSENPTVLAFFPVLMTVAVILLSSSSDGRNLDASIRLGCAGPYRLVGDMFNGGSCPLFSYFHLNDRTAKDIMTPRTQLSFVRADASLLDVKEYDVKSLIANTVASWPLEKPSTT